MHAKGLGMRWLLTAGAVLAAGMVWAVIVVQEGALQFQDDKGQPIPQAKVSIDFGGATLDAQTDDHGKVGLILLPSGQSAKDDDDDHRGAFVLIGEGPGRIHYPGGPAEGVPFTVRGGALVLETPAASPGPNKTLLIGGGAVLVGGIAAVASGGGGAQPSMVASTNGTVMATPTPTPTPEPKLDRTGAFGAQFQVADNPAGHPNRIPGMTTLHIDNTKGLTAHAALVRVTADDPAFIPVQGTLEDSGHLVADGAGNYAGYGTTATLDITFDGADRFSGRYSIGEEGGLPTGQPITWNVTGTR